VSEVLLRETPKKGKEVKYSTLNKELRHKEYRFPSELFATYGIKQLQEQLKDLKASQIPNIISNAIGLEITEKEKQEFEQIKELRHKIAHGKITEVDLTKSVEINRFLRHLAQKIDQHIY